MARRSSLTAFIGLGALSVAGLLLSCNESAMTGSGSQRGANLKPHSDEATPTASPRPNGPQQSEDLGQTVAPTALPIDDTDYGNGDGRNDQSIYDILGSMFDSANNVVINQPNDNNIDIGNGVDFRIGDNSASGSSCTQQVETYAVSGTRYVFEFEVKRPNTQVAVRIGRLCGVDYQTSNIAYLSAGGQPIGQIYPVPVGANGMGLPPLTLNQGYYALIVESCPNGGEPGAQPGDADDFIVGGINIQANQAIRPGHVGALTPPIAQQQIVCRPF